MQLDVVELVEDAVSWMVVSITFCHPLESSNDKPISTVSHGSWCYVQSRELGMLTVFVAVLNRMGWVHFGLFAANIQTLPPSFPFGMAAAEKTND
jgi:hypothetical protein